jgi:hypothetical protein
MADYNDKFPPGLSDEEKAALAWKIEKDYQSSNLGAVSFKDEYIAFAVNFYTRSLYSLEEVVVMYRAHKASERRRQLAQAFMADMLSRAREQNSVLALLE